MDQKTKRKIFGSLIREETIILSIMIEISLIAENTKNKSSNKEDELMNLSLNNKKN